MAEQLLLLEAERPRRLALVNAVAVERAQRDLAPTVAIGAAPAAEDSEALAALAASDDLHGLRARFLLAIEHLPTRSQRRYELEAFFSWCAEVGVDPLAVRRTDAERWRDHLLHHHIDARLGAERRGAKLRRAGGVGVATSTVRGRLSAASMFLAFTIDEQRRPGPNPFDGVSRPPRRDRDPKSGWLSPAQVLALLQTARAQGPLPHALASLLLTYGQLSSHVKHLRCGDLTRRAAEPGRPAAREISLVMRGLERVSVELDEDTSSSLDELGVPERPPDAPMFHVPREPTRPLSRLRVARLLEPIAEAAGIAPWDLWVAHHTFCVLALQAGIGEQGLARYLGARWSGQEKWAAAEDPPVLIARLLRQILDA